MQVGFIGIGSMGGMLVRTMVRSGGLRPGQVWAANRSSGKLDRLVADLPGIHTAPADEVVRRCPVLILGVKPGETWQCLDEVVDALSSDHLLIVMSNMLDLGTVEGRVPARVARVIPSLAHTVLGGVALITYGSRCGPADRRLVERLFSRIAKPYVIPEHLGRTCADLTSCGPAFLAFMLRAMAEAACRVEPDLDPRLATALVQETVMATARLLVEAGFSCEAIMERIAVPNGITADGLRMMGDWVPGGWRELFTATRDLEAAKKAASGAPAR